MNTIWRTLPIDLINLIIEYDGIMKLRNGKFMNQIPNIDMNYKFILDCICNQSSRRFYKTGNVSVVNIHIQDTGKFLFYWATENELRITLHIPNIHSAKIIYYNKY